MGQGPYLGPMATWTFLKIDMGHMNRREIINGMTYVISKNRHATLSHFKIDMEILKIVTRDMMKIRFDMQQWGPPV